MLLKRKAPSAKSNIKNDSLSNNIKFEDRPIVKEEALDTVFTNFENNEKREESNSELNFADRNSSVIKPLTIHKNITISEELPDIVSVDNPVSEKCNDEILNDKSTTLAKKKSEVVTGRKRKLTTSASISKVKNKIKPPKSLDSGVYVECDLCHKTRYLKDILNPSAIPPVWTCEMANSSLNCSVPQENFENSVNYFINNNYTLGSVVWAKAPGFCWWPAIIDDDPDLDMFYWCYEHSDDVSHYHVTFLDDDVSRSWITTKDIKVFRGKADMSSMKLNKYKKNYLKSLSKAVERAEECTALSLQECLDKYSFAIRYNGKPNLWTSTTNSAQRKSRSKPFHSSDGSTSERESKSSSNKNRSKIKTVKTQKKCEDLSIEVSKIEAKCEILSTLNQQTKHDLIVKNSSKETKKKMHNKKNKKPEIVEE